MNFRRLFQVAVAVKICVLVLGLTASADEPLSMKVELRHGPNGPKVRNDAAPGEQLFLAVSVVGLTTGENGKAKVHCSRELRSDDDELLVIPFQGEQEYELGPGSERMVYSDIATIPVDYRGKTLRHVLVVRDAHSGKEIKQVTSIAVKQPTGPYPYLVTYWHDNQPHSGKFTTGDLGVLRYVVGGIKATKSIACKLEFIPRGESKAIKELKFNTEIPKVKSEYGIPTYFSFHASTPFEGTTRLTITDDAGHTNSVELPLQVTEALGSDETNFLAERPSSESPPTKKE